MANLLTVVCIVSPDLCDKRWKSRLLRACTHYIQRQCLGASRPISYELCPHAEAHAQQAQHANLIYGNVEALASHACVMLGQAHKE